MGYHAQSNKSHHHSSSLARREVAAVLLVHHCARQELDEVVCKQRLVFTFVAFHCTEPPGFSGRRRRARPGRPPRSWRKRGRRPHWPGRARQRCAPRTCAEAAWVSGRESVGGGVAGFALRVERLEESLAGRLACLREGAAQVACLVYLIDPRGRALLCDELETGPPVVVIAAACNAPAPCQAMPTKRQTGDSEGTHRRRCQSTWPRKRR